MTISTIPTLTPVTSSNIKAVGHDPATNTLYVQFFTNTTYSYRPVSAQTAADMLAAESVGKFFHRHIKTNLDITFTKL